MEMTSSKPSLTIGTDPEFMLLDNKGNLRSAINILNCGKDERIDLGNDVKVFFDNVLIEMNIKPADSPEMLVDSLRDAFRRVTSHVSPIRINVQASAIFPESELKDPNSWIYGCSPEYDAYQMSVINPPVAEKGNNLRSCGGHVHLGTNEESFPLMAPIENKDTDDEDRSKRDWGRVWVVRMLDLFLGVPALFIDHDPTSAQRRKLYGKCGSHRPKEEYGVEYRPTSNFWLASPKLATLIYKLCDFTVDFVREGKHMELWKDENDCHYDVKNMCKTINDSDLNSAKKIMEGTIKKYMPKSLYSEIFKLSDPMKYDFNKEWEL